jgi:hypothetical protein
MGKKISLVPDRDQTNYLRLASGRSGGAGVASGLSYLFTGSLYASAQEGGQGIHDLLPDDLAALTFHEGQFS